MDKTNRTIYIIAAVFLIIVLVAIYFLFIFQKKPKEPKSEESEFEVKSVQDIELAKRPYITLTPTTDGAEIVLSIENMDNFDNIEYELTYLADNPQIAGEKIQRGSTGTDVNPKEPKYKKSILLGTASKGVRSPDKGVTDGKLTMHMFKGGTEFTSETTWVLTQAGSKASEIKDQSQKLKFNLPALDKDHWIIITDTLGVPPDNKEFKVNDVILPVYGVFSVAPQFPKSASLSINLDKDVKSPQLYTFSHTESKWQKLEVTIDESSKTISVQTNSFATFVIVSSK